MEIPLQQTKLWQKLQQDLGETTFFLSDQSDVTNSPEENSEATSPADVNYQMLIIKKSTRLGPYFYLPYGPYLANKSAARRARKALEALERREDVIFTRIEPQSAENASYWLTAPNCRKSQNLNPEETWILDLSQSLDEIYHGMKQGTRTRCKNYAKKGISVEKAAKTPDNLAILMNFLQKIAKSRHFSPAEADYIKKEAAQDFCSLFISYYTPAEGQSAKDQEGPSGSSSAEKSQKIPIAASLFFDDGTTRFYMQSGADPEFKKLPGTNALLIEAIRDAQEKNLKFFDFWGIAPENAPENHPWAGFTTFKKSFGGFAKSYAGTYDLVRKPGRYKLYQLLRKLNRLIRRMR